MFGFSPVESELRNRIPPPQRSASPDVVSLTDNCSAPKRYRRLPEEGERMRFFDRRFRRSFLWDVGYARTSDPIDNGNVSVTI
jgi:hypothetical protein